jgi:hypothetical protein
MTAGLGAEAFPRLVIGTMAVLAVLIALGIGSAPMAPPPAIPRMVWITSAVLLAFAVAVELIGMWPACVALVIGLGRLWGERSLAKLAVSALLLCGVLYYVFVRLLGSSFPAGLVGS